MTVSDDESFKKIPDVLGLVSYRVDNKKLYVNQGTKWQALSSEPEVSLNSIKVIYDVFEALITSITPNCATNYIRITYHTYRNKKLQKQSA